MTTHEVFAEAARLSEEIETAQRAAFTAAYTDRRAAEIGPYQRVNPKTVEAWPYPPVDEDLEALDPETYGKPARHLLDYADKHPWA